LDQSTNRVLEHIEDPHRPGRWRRTGLVVGQVQSGKTGNYIGLACKAADAGYKLIIILAGIHNSLRSQTQLRVDEGLLGFDTQYQQRSDQTNGSSRIGVGAMPGVTRLKIASLTNSSEKGDFNRRVASSMNLPIGDFPVVLVVKKHRSILEYIRRWIVEVEGQASGEGTEPTVPDVPLLVIDDEADHASVDTTREEDTEPTKVNGAIRRLLHSFDKAAYIGYTATPFANIYISPTAEHDVYGFDLFPESFVESLPAPSNYLGPERVFGLSSDDPDVEIPALPIYRPVEDSETWMPTRPKHRKTWTPPEPLPDSLEQAIHAFVLTCAARRARGQIHAHNSMLVHVTRYIEVQNTVRDQIDDYVGLLRDRLRDTRGDQARKALEELEELWNSDFEPTTAVFPHEDAPRLAWTDVAAEIRHVLQRLQVRAINGSSRDALEYYEHRRTGLTVIAIGGDRLSRGLTLEGLSVSYYLRASTAYDTLLQMGRWFGYRPAYEDLCRLYTSPDLFAAYREITIADNELRRDFEDMAALNETPTNFGLRVRSSSAGLAVTAPNKMRRGVKVRLSYSGDLPETTTFSLREEALTRNLRNLEGFVTSLDATYPSGPPNSGSGVLWRGVPASEVIEGFLDGYVPDRGLRRVRPAFIAEYIRRCLVQGELTSWNVLLASNSQQPNRRLTIAGRTVGLIRRAAREGTLEADCRYTIRRVLSPADESADLDDEQMDVALKHTRIARRFSAEKRGREYKEPDVPSGQPLRRVRRSDQPLLIVYPLARPEDDAAEDAVPVVGFAISFPFSENPTATEYVVNEIWQQQEIDDWDDGEEQP
jgi:hypothetical protein